MHRLVPALLVTAMLTSTAIAAKRTTLVPFAAAATAAAVGL